MQQAAIFFVPPLEKRRRHTNLGKYFPGYTVKVDKRFQTFVDKGRRFSSTPRLTCAVITPASPIGADDVFVDIMKRLPYGFLLDVPTLHALLSYIGSVDGMAILAIPQREYEINLVLGYMQEYDKDPKKDPKKFVLYVEHEFEDGEREIHLHARPAGKWDDDLPRALLILSEDD